MTEENTNDKDTHEQAEERRVEESSMSEKMLVWDAEGKGYDVGIGDN